MRSNQHSHIAKQLESLDDDAISALISQGTHIHAGFGTSIKIEIEGTTVFVKQVPLNELEGNNTGSTENLFNLPIYYQYGVNSAGFNVWRELASHVMTTDWVLADEIQNFPLMYHWRILNCSQEKEPLDEDKLKKYVNYWENSLAIDKRIRANHSAPTNVVLFIEYYPETLLKWLPAQLAKGYDAADKAVAMVIRNFQETATFTLSKDMIHLDTHLNNILTDGERLYFSDFGLALSLQFDLSKDEKEFFKVHKSYDRCYVASEITNLIILELFGEDRLNTVLQDYANGNTPQSLPQSLTPYLATVIKRYAQITLTMNTFFDNLRKKIKNTPFPKDELEQLWTKTII